MAAINTGSDLLETLLTPQEEYQAKTFQNMGLTIAYLQNSKVLIVRRLALQSFGDPEKDEQEQRERSYLRGQLDLLETMCAEAISAQPPVIDPSSNSTQQTS